MYLGAEVDTTLRVRPKIHIYTKSAHIHIRVAVLTYSTDESARTRSSPTSQVLVHTYRYDITSDAERKHVQVNGVTSAVHMIINRHVRTSIMGACVVR